jgi:hypothetical protein
MFLSISNARPPSPTSLPSEAGQGFGEVGRALSVPLAALAYCKSIPQPSPAFIHLLSLQFGAGRVWRRSRARRSSANRSRMAEVRSGLRHAPIMGLEAHQLTVRRAISRTINNHSGKCHEIWNNGRRRCRLLLWCEASKGRTPCSTCWPPACGREN